jgi:hypothetical protein
MVQFRVPRSDEVTALISGSGADDLEYDKRSDCRAEFAARGCETQS